MTRGVWLPCQGDTAGTVWLFVYVLCICKVHLLGLYNARPSLNEADMRLQQPYYYYFIVIFRLYVSWR